MPLCCQQVDCWTSKAMSAPAKWPRIQWSPSSLWIPQNCDQQLHEWIHLTIAKWSSTGPLDLLEQSFPIPWSTTLVTMEGLVLPDHPTTNFSCCTHAKSSISHISLFHHPFYFFIYIRSVSLHFSIPLSSFSSPSCLHNLFPWPFSDKNYFFLVTSSLTKIYHINMQKEKTWLMLTSVYVFTVLPHLFSS